MAYRKKHRLFVSWKFCLKRKELKKKRNTESIPPWKNKSLGTDLENLHSCCGSEVHLIPSPHSTINEIFILLLGGGGGLLDWQIGVGHSVPANISLPRQKQHLPAAAPDWGNEIPGLPPTPILLCSPAILSKAFLHLLISFLPNWSFYLNPFTSRPFEVRNIKHSS